MQDSKVIHFLRQFPAWIVLLFLTLVFLALFYVTNEASYKEWTALLLSSLFTALGMQRVQQPSQSANTETGDVIVKPTDPPTELMETEIKEEK